MLEAVGTSEMLVNYQTTQCNIPEDIYLHTYCCENLKPHLSGNLELMKQKKLQTVYIVAPSLLWFYSNLTYMEFGNTENTHQNSITFSIQILK
jgi:hypothetical protein